MEYTMVKRLAHITVIYLTGTVGLSQIVLADSGASSEIRELFATSYESAVNNEDASAFAAQFTDDGLRVPPNRPPEGTREGIQSGIEKVFQKFDFNVSVEVENVKPEGRFAWVSARATGERSERSSGKNFPVDVRYMVIMRKGGDGWRIFRQAWYPIK